MKRILSLCLCFLTFLSLFTSCARKTPSQTPAEKETRSAPETAKSAETEPISTSGEPLPDWKETEKKRLLSMTPEEAYEELYRPAEELYSVFDGGASWMEYDPGVTYDAGNYAIYYLVTEKGLTNMDQLGEIYRRCFSERFFEKLVEQKVIIEKDSRLWILPLGRGSNLLYLGNTRCEIKESGEDLIMTLSSDYILDSYFMAIDDYENIPEEYTETLSSDLRMVFENGSFKFDDFCSSDMAGC